MIKCAAVIVAVVVTHRSPFGCSHCQPNHRVGLKFVIASVTPCVITLRAGCQGNSCNCSAAHPHATYHTVMQGTTMHIAMYHISRTTLYNTMYHTLICRKQNCYNTTGHILCAPYHLHTSPRNILYFRLHHNTTSTTSCTNGLRSYEMRYDTSNQSTTPG